MATLVESWNALCKRLGAWFAKWAGRQGQTTPAPVTTAKPRKPKADKEDEWRSGGEFYFRDAILDQLDRYFAVLKRMRRADPDAYDYFSRLGANMLPWRPETGWGLETKAEWLKRLPSRGGVFTYHPKAEKDEIARDFATPCAMYFAKYDPKKSPIGVERVGNGVVYVVTIYWDDLAHGSMGVPTEFPVAVTPSGDVRVLRTLIKRQTVRGKRGQPFQIPTQRWGISDYYKRMAARHESSPNDYLLRLFENLVIMHASATHGSMTRVVAKRDGLASAFAVNIERTPYFFADRDVRVGVRRKRIFHIVRGHERTLPDGRRQVVRTHFRGERSFNWNGYQIEISVPGWHAFNVGDVDVSAVTSELPLPDGEVMSEAAFADRIGVYEAAGLGGFKRARR